VEGPSCLYTRVLTAKHSALKSPSLPVLRFLTYTRIFSFLTFYAMFLASHGWSPISLLQTCARNDNCRLGGRNRRRNVSYIGGSQNRTIHEYKSVAPA
jgi:hypothetical protein